MVQVVNLVESLVELHLLKTMRFLNYKEGVFWPLHLSVELNVKSGGVIYSEGDFYNDFNTAQYYNKVKIADMKSALTLKEILVNGIGEPDYNYPFYPNKKKYQYEY